MVELVWPVYFDFGCFGDIGHFVPTAFHSLLSNLERGAAIPQSERNMLKTVLVIDNVDSLEQTFASSLIKPF